MRKIGLDKSIELINDELSIQHTVNADVIFNLQFARLGTCLIQWKLSFFAEVVFWVLKDLNLALGQKVGFIFFPAIVFDRLIQKVLLDFFGWIVSGDANLDESMIPDLVEV